MNLKQLPFFILNKCRHINNRRKTTEEIFTEIYSKKKWGGSEEYSSGSGSHIDNITKPYIDSVIKFIKESNIDNPTLVDLGCGDFCIGRQIYPYAWKYIACDIAKPVLDFNRSKYNFPNLEFSHIDIILDPLPDGDICFIRQVLQHLSNEQILKILGKITKYKYIVITEHYPNIKEFKHFNIDKPHGADIRAYYGSGVYLNQPPFSISTSKIDLLCEAESPILNPMKYHGVIKTFLYSP